MEGEEIMNSTESTVSDELPVHPALVAGYAFGICTAGASTLVYAWILATIASEPSLHNVSNYFIASLCVSEMVLGILTAVWCGIMMSSQTHPALKLAASMSCVFFGIVTYFLHSVAVAADRYLKISRPLRYPQLVTPRRCAGLVAAFWGLSLAFGLVMLLSAVLIFDPDRQESFGSILQDEEYRIPTAILSTLTLFPSMVAMTYLIAALVRVARQQRRKVKDEMLTLRRLQDQAQQQQQTARPPQPRPSQSVDKTIVYFVVHFSCFVVAWLPATVSMNLNIICRLTPAVFDPLLAVSGCIALFDTFLGTLFLAYAQPEHRQAARSNLERMKRFFCER